MQKSLKHKPIDREWLGAFLDEADKNNLHHLSALILFMNHTGIRANKLTYRSDILIHTQFKDVSCISESVLTLMHNETF